MLGSFTSVIYSTLYYREIILLEKSRLYCCCIVFSALPVTEYRFCIFHHLTIYPTLWLCLLCSHVCCHSGKESERHREIEAGGEIRVYDKRVRLQYLLLPSYAMVLPTRVCR